MSKNTYSDEQKEAVIAAVLEQGMTKDRASKAAAAGELGLEPFDIPPNTVNHYASQARRTREVGGYKDRLHALADRALKAIEVDMQKAETAGIGGKLDVPRFKRDAQAAQHVARLVQLLEGGDRPPKPLETPGPPNTNTPDRVSALVQGLERDVDKAPPNGTQDAEGPDHDHGHQPRPGNGAAETTAAADTKEQEAAQPR